MTKTEALKRLKTLGTAQNRKVYARHGVKGEQYGVSFANLAKLKKAIQTDHALAEQLWATGNHDARILACMVAEPARVSARQLETWVKDLDNYVVADALAGLAGKSRHARKCMENWSARREEWMGTSGWNLVSRLAMDHEGLSDAYFEKYLQAIESKIHKSKNRVRHSMNNALIAIGLRNPRLEKKAVAIAKRIGKVEVDHGRTSCQTPDAIQYIQKTKEYRQKRRRAGC